MKSQSRGLTLLSTDYGVSCFWFFLMQRDYRHKFCRFNVKRFITDKTLTAGLVRGYTQRPPSTSRQAPVMKEASSEPRYRQALAISSGVEKRPSGIVAVNFLRFSGVSGTPMNSVSRPVAEITGLTQLTRILSGPSSAAIDLLVVITAPLLPLYQVRPGRGRMPAVDAMLMKAPPPALRKCGTNVWALRKILLTLMAYTRSNSSSVTSSIGRLRWVVPALLTTICRPPKASSVAASKAFTSPLRETSVRK